MRYEKYIIGKLFTSQNGDTDIKKEDIKGEGIPVISSGLDNDGILGLTDVKAKIIKPNTITIDMFGNAFYRAFEYKMVTHGRVFSMELIDGTMDDQIGLYLATQFHWLTKIFNYGNMCSYAKIKDLTIILPTLDILNKNSPYSDKGYVPDFDYMREKIVELEREKVIELEEYLISTGLNNPGLTDEDIEILSLSGFGNYKELENKDLGNIYKNFKISDLFSLQKVSNKLNKECLSDDYEYPVYSSDTNNNGIIGYTDNPEFVCNDEIPVYITFGDHTRTLNIARKSFGVLDNVKVLIPCINNDKVLLYIKTQWQKQIPNLGYSRHWKIAKECLIPLPIQLDDKIPVLDKERRYHKDGYIPDWDFMEKYIKVIEKIVIADVVKYKDEYIKNKK